MPSILLSNTKITIAINKSVNRMTRIINKFFLNTVVKKILIGNQISIGAYQKQIFRMTNGDKDGDKK